MRLNSITLLNIITSQETAYLVTFTVEIFYGKFHFLCSDYQKKALPMITDPNTKVYLVG